MRRSLFFLCAVALLGPAQAAPLWTNIGPLGGEARSLSSDVTGRNVYLLNPRNGVFRSFNGGPWTLVFDTMARGVTPTHVLVDPVTSRVYIGASTGLFRSDDDGSTWRQLINQAIIDISAYSDQVVISTSEELARSTDGGTNWSSISSLPIPMGTADSIVRIEPAPPNRLFAVAAGNLFVNDAGNSWKKLSPTKIVAVVFGDFVYAGGSDGVWQCTDTCTQMAMDSVEQLAFWSGSLYASAGEMFMRFGAGRFDGLRTAFPGVAALSIEATPTALLVGTIVGVFSTVDGVRWTSRNEGLTNVRITAMAMTSQRLVAATVGDGFLRRDVGGWTPASGDLPFQPPFGRTVRYLATNGSTVYAVLPGAGLSRSAEEGRTWESLTAGLGFTDIFGLAADGDKVAATNFRIVALSLDRGTTWQVLTHYARFTATVVALKDRVIVVADVADAIISLDNGDTWQTSEVPSAIRHFAIAGDRIYAGTDVGLFVRKDGVWSLALPGQVKAIATSGSQVYASVTSGVYFSSDGASWVFVPGSETLPPDVTSVASDGFFVYAGTDGGSIFATSLQWRRRAARH
jgi:hypothetical protein